MAVAVTAMIFAIGNIVLGHFEERTPKWRRVTKVFLVTGLVALISRRFGGDSSRLGSCWWRLSLSICGGCPVTASTAWPESPETGTTHSEAGAGSP